MYLRRLHVERLKRAHDLTLNFLEPDGSPRMWTVFIGQNGTAKTTLLQAIALAAAGPLQVNALAKPVVGHLRDRRSPEAMHVTADFDFTPLGCGRPDLHPEYPEDEWRTGSWLRSKLDLNSGETTIRGSSVYMFNGNEIPGHVPGGDPLDGARSNNRPHWFVAGYGISRSLPDPSARPLLGQPSIERMEPLFRPTYGLTSLSFSDHFVDDDTRDFSGVLKRALTRVEKLVPDIIDIELRGRGGVRSAGDLMERDRFVQTFGEHKHKIPAVALSHGYQSTISWVADLIGHVMLEADQAVEAEHIEGLVLIDEIDLYLHPSWQASIVSALKAVFPRVQFIATTHSPVILAGLEPAEVIRLGVVHDTGNVVHMVHDRETGELVPSTKTQDHLEPDPRTLTGSGIYRDFFGIERATLNPHGEDLRLYNRLASDPFRSDDEDAELVRVRQRLDDADIRVTRDPIDREETP